MKMKEMEEEATKLRQYQADVDEEMNLSSSSLPGVQSPQFLSQDEKKEIDARSIYVGNVSSLDQFATILKSYTVSNAICPDRDRVLSPSLQQVVDGLTIIRK